MIYHTDGEEKLFTCMILSGLMSVKETKNFVILTIALTNETFKMYNIDHCFN